ncbi:MAG: response regulator transcription factor [Candidatus Obscuribacterales bacterium]|nr:response regulator transcription factor [Candidatus Obscuribacterales bacterium]
MTASNENDFPLHWLTQVLHDTTKLDQIVRPQGQWSTLECDAEGLLSRFSAILSSHQNSPPAVLTWLAKFDCPHIQERVAEHPNTPAKTLAELACSSYSDVRAAIADNPNASDDLLRKLVDDECVDVRFRIAENCNVPADLLHRLADDENPFVAVRAKRSLEQTNGQMQGSKSDHKLSLLLVDDDDVTRLILSLALKNDPLVRVIGQATSGATAIQMARNLKPDIVLMDIGMPHMNGIVSTSFIKKELPDTKVIMVTAHDHLEEIVGAFGHGAEGYHLKTSSRQDLSKAIRVVASGAFWLDPGIVSTVLRELTKTSMPIVQQKFYATHESEARRLSDPVQSLMQIVEEYVSNKNFDQARQICRNAVNLSQEMYGDSPSTTAALNRLADLYFIDQEYSTSEATYLDLVKLQSRLCNLDDPSLDNYLGFLSDLYQFRGSTEQAELFASWHVRVRENLGEPAKLAEARERLNHILESKKQDYHSADKVH